MLKFLQRQLNDYKSHNYLTIFLSNEEEYTFNRELCDISVDEWSDTLVIEIDDRVWSFSERSILYWKLKRRMEL